MLTFLENDYGLFFCADSLLIRKESQTFLFSFQEIFSNNIQKIMEKEYCFIGKTGEKRVYAIELSQKEAEQGDYILFPIRKILETADLEKKQLIFQGKQLLYWHQTTRFCGACGALTKLSETETAKICQECQRIIFPSCSPAVIATVERGNEILLGRQPHFSPGVYSTLAGFIAPGETGEQALVREVWEEVSIKIHKINYFGSQMWPFPNSFMIGYQAQYAEGEIELDGYELEDARWFTVENLPLLPSEISISRWLIDDFIKRNSE